jgi:hypothetical protein
VITIYFRMADAEAGYTKPAFRRDGVSFIGFVLTTIFWFAFSGMVAMGLSHVFGVHHAYHTSVMQTNNTRNEALGTLELYHCRERFGRVTEQERLQHAHVKYVGTEACDRARVTLAEKPWVQVMVFFFNHYGWCEPGKCYELVTDTFFKAMTLGAPSLVVVVVVLWWMGGIRAGGTSAADEYYRRLIEKEFRNKKHD